MNSELTNLWHALNEVHDPEFPMGLVEMGLVYGVAREDDRVRVQLTFTAMGCPAMEMILGDVRARLLQEPNVRDVQIEIVWDPPWNISRMTENGRALLREFGVAN